MNTQDGSVEHYKVLLYAHHGWGKTTQCALYQRAFGSGFIISGESGLSSIRSAGIDYLPFSSWDGTTDPTVGQYSFTDIFRWMRTKAFARQGYKWIGLDSLTELSDHSLRHAEALAEAQAIKTSRPVNGFEVWTKHTQQLIGACKAIRDMPMHFLVTALAKESEDENGSTHHWPMVAGKQVQTQLPGIFDWVLAGIRTTAQSAPDKSPKVARLLVTDEVRGWHAKVRDEGRRLKPVERSSSVVDLLQRVMMDDGDYNQWLAQQAPSQEATT